MVKVKKWEVSPGVGFSLRSRRTGAYRIVHVSDVHFRGDDGIPIQIVLEHLDKAEFRGFEIDHVVVVPGSHDVAEASVVLSHPAPSDLSRVRIEQPFATLVMRALRACAPGKVNTSALAQTIEDVRHEINEALAEGRHHQVRWLQVRGWYLVTKMVLLELASTTAAIKKLIG